MDQGKGKKSSLRLVPRDISESLGKLPPQAIDMEEAVLGAVMLERPAMDEVMSFLKPEHFYTQAHKEIFAAAVKLKEEDHNIDMRTMVSTLRKNGKIELIGGASYIAELTSKVSSAANIRHHAAIIVEMSIKRELILIAHDIHTKAYADENDAFELLDEVEEKFDFFKKHKIPQNSESRIKALWEKTLILSAPPEEPPLVMIDGTPIAIPGNHTLVVGKKKSRKTLFIVYLIAEYLKAGENNASKVLLFDTEQGKSHVYALREKIYKLTGLWVPVFYLRGMSPTERQEFIAFTIQYWKTPPKLIVIDGIRDLMTNINDPEESTNLIVWLEKLTLNYNVGIIEILHLNKTDNNARGHIGTELLNKALCTIEMEIDEKNGCTVVKCESARDKPFETFAFTHDENGLPQIVGTPVKGKIIAPDDKKARLEAIFEDGPLKFAELLEEVCIQFEIGQVKGKQMIAELTRHGFIMKSGGARSPNTIYKLISTSANGQDTPKPVQATLPLEQKVEKEEEPVDLPF